MKERAGAWVFLWVDGRECPGRQAEDRVVLVLTRSNWAERWAGSSPCIRAIPKQVPDQPGTCCPDIFLVCVFGPQLVRHIQRFRDEFRDVLLGDNRTQVGIADIQMCLEHHIHFLDRGVRFLPFQLEKNLSA